MTTVSKVFNTDIHTPCQYTHAHTLIHIHTYRDGFIRDKCQHLSQNNDKHRENSVKRHKIGSKRRKNAAKTPQKKRRAPPPK